MRDLITLEEAMGRLEGLADKMDRRRALGVRLDREDSDTLTDLRTLLSALRSRPTREDVARVIDPWAFENVPHRGRLMRGARALADAQAVLRLFEGGE
jgi:hypothetical protein